MENIRGEKGTTGEQSGKRNNGEQSRKKGQVEKNRMDKERTVGKQNEKRQTENGHCFLNSDDCSI